jgi:hypothetical protein
VLVLSWDDKGESDSDDEEMEDIEEMETVDAALFGLMNVRD